MMKRYKHVFVLTRMFFLVVFNEKIKLDQSFSISSAKNIEVKIKQAMILSNKGQENVSDAYLAASLWEEILKKEQNHELHEDSSSFIRGRLHPCDVDNNEYEQFELSTKLKSICNTIYAATLIRIGRDFDAILVHDETLNLIEDNRDHKQSSDKVSESFDDENLSLWMDVKIAKGEALQRLMKYDEARNEFTMVWKYCDEHGRNEETQEKVSQCAFKAALCCMRCRNLLGAKEILCLEYDRVKKLEFDVCPNVAGFLGILEIETNTEKQSGLDKLYHASQSNIASPIYKWFHSLALDSQHGSNVDLPSLYNEYEQTQFKLLSSINNSPFDDPMLIHLDDKVLLHKLLSSKKTDVSSWPKGYVFPDDENSFKRNESCSLEATYWMLKQRAGYGSHGNQIVSTKAVIPTTLSASLKYDDKMLCQKLIEPILCKDGRKFSLRVYVIYFPSDIKTNSSAYLSSIGLMKLALTKVTDGAKEDVRNIFMTNSGLASTVESEAEIQYDFEYLKHYVNESFGPGSFERIWNAVEASVVRVMTSYLELRSISSLQDEPKTIMFKVPKILGFDYIIDTSFNPWLLEVNRFPGLEARGESDRRVKALLLQEVWKLAKKKCKGTMTFDISDVLQEIVA